MIPSPPAPAEAAFRGPFTEGGGWRSHLSPWMRGALLERLRPPPSLPAAGGSSRSSSIFSAWAMAAAAAAAVTAGGSLASCRAPGGEGLVPPTGPTKGAPHGGERRWGTTRGSPPPPNGRGGKKTAARAHSGRQPRRSWPTPRTRGRAGGQLGRGGGAGRRGKRSRDALRVRARKTLSSRGRQGKKREVLNAVSAAFARHNWSRMRGWACPQDRSWLVRMRYRRLTTGC